MPAAQQPGREAVDDAGAAADPVRAVHWVFHVRDATDNMPWVEEGGHHHGVRVPRGVNPHGGVHVARAMGGRDTGGVAAQVAGGGDQRQPGYQSSYQVVRAAQRPRAQPVI
jgi:hypothetical protein